MEKQNVDTFYEITTHMIIVITSNRIMDNN